MEAGWVPVSASESFPPSTDQSRSSVVVVLRVEQRRAEPIGPVSVASFASEQNFRHPFRALAALWAVVVVER